MNGRLRCSQRQGRERMAKDSVSEESDVRQNRKRRGRSARGATAVSALRFEQHSQLRQQLAVESVSNAYAFPGDFGLRQVSLAASRERAILPRRSSLRATRSLPRPDTAPRLLGSSAPRLLSPSLPPSLLLPLFGILAELLHARRVYPRSSVERDARVPRVACRENIGENAGLCPRVMPEVHAATM